jgi:hypothetical protein
MQAISCRHRHAAVSAGGSGQRFAPTTIRRLAQENTDWGAPKIHGELQKQYSSEKPADPTELRIYRGADGRYILYEDEGDTYNYEKQQYATIPISWDEAKRTLEFGERVAAFTTC